MWFAFLNMYLGENPFRNCFVILLFEMVIASVDSQ